MSKHTKGIARIATEVGPCLVEVGDRELCDCEVYQDDEVQMQEDDANARRLVACWNACERISTEVLESVQDFKAAGIKSIESVERDNAALGEALLRSANALGELARNTTGGLKQFAEDYESRARALLAKYPKAPS